MEMKTVAKALADGTLLGKAFETETPPKRANGRSIRQTPQYAGALARALVGTLKLLLLLAGAVFFWKVFSHAYVSDRFVLAEVTIEGNRQVEGRYLEGIVRQEFPAALLRIDLRRLQERLEMEPWVQRAEVRRVLPDRLVLRVVEREPKAVAVVDGSFHLVDAEGFLLGKQDSAGGAFDLPLLKGLLPPGRDQAPEENQRRAALFFAVLEALDAGGTRRSQNISEVDVSRADDVVFIPMNETVTVHLGDKDFLPRYQTLIDHWPDYQKAKAERGPIESIDLRYMGQVVMRQEHQMTVLPSKR